MLKKNLYLYFIVIGIKTKHSFVSCLFHLALCQGHFSRTLQMLWVKVMVTSGSAPHENRAFVAGWAPCCLDGENKGEPEKQIWEIWVHNTNRLGAELLWEGVLALSGSVYTWESPCFAGGPAGWFHSSEIRPGQLQWQEALTWRSARIESVFGGPPWRSNG